MEFKDKTRVILGCDECPSRQEHSFNQSPLAVLYGIDTLGLPGRVEVETPIINHNQVLWIRTQTFRQDMPDCDPKNCERSQRIQDVAAVLIKHAETNGPAD